VAYLFVFSFIVLDVHLSCFVGRTLYRFFSHFSPFLMYYYLASQPSFFFFLLSWSALLDTTAYAIDWNNHSRFLASYWSIINLRQA
jgi:hypothetical protein